MQATDIAGNVEAVHTSADKCVKVDPAQRPPQIWFDKAYSFKRKVVVVNPASDQTIPQSYPVNLHFDSSTSPTAAEIYNASVATTKGDDVRVVYNDQYDVARFFTTFSPSAVDIWFNAQAPIAAAGSSSSYQLYYMNPAATSQGVSARYIMAPQWDSSTRLKMDFDEGSGGVTSDSSGYGNTGTVNGATWSSGKFLTALYFNGSSNSNVRINDSSSLQISGPLTVEAWVKPTLLDNNTRNVVSKFNPNYGPSWRIYLINGVPHFYVWAGNSEARVDPPESKILQLNQWQHLAGTYDGSYIRLFLNGVEIGNTSFPNHSLNTTPGGAGLDWYYWKLK